jgi:hypothetical protein
MRFCNNQYRWYAWALLVGFCVAGKCLAQNESPQEKAAQAAEAAQRRQQELLGHRQEREQLQQQRVMLEQQRAMLEQQLRELEIKRAALGQQMSQLQSPQMMMELLRGQQNMPRPQDGTLKVFSLQNSRAADAARILSEIMGGGVARMAVDERTNSLLVFADEDTIKIVEALALKLDERSDETNVEMARPGETLQLRIVWLLDGVNGGIDDPTHKLISPEVVDALRELGFADPMVVCQQVTTLTLSNNRGRSGEFNYAVPVLINSQPWHFEGHGQIESMAEERFNLRFDLKFQQRIDANGKRMGQEGQLGGSIYTPLGHYTVMGTTTFVAVIPNESIQQHLSAFVVYLDRAREFPAALAPSNERTEVRR